MKIRTIGVIALALVSLLSFKANAQQISGGGAGGGGTPCTVTASAFQYNNSGAFGCGMIFYPSSANNANGGIGDGTNFQLYWNIAATSLEFRNTADNAFVPILSSSFQTGTGRPFYSSNGVFNNTVNSANLTTSDWRSPMQALEFGVAAGMSWSTTSTMESGSYDTGISRIAAKVLGVGNATAADASGWWQWGGQSRVTADQTFTSTTTLANITGLSLNVAAGRTYSFEADISWTDAAAGGIQLAIAGTATATAIIYDGWIIDSGANGIKGNAQATALAGAVASSTTTGTAGHAKISGTITVNAAGTLTVQAAQNTSNGTATTIKRGSKFVAFDMP